MALRAIQRFGQPANWHRTDLANKNNNVLAKRRLQRHFLQIVLQFFRFAKMEMLKTQGFLRARQQKIARGKFGKLFL